MDATDKDAVHSALREMNEEIGVAMETVEVLGTMPALPSHSVIFFFLFLWARKVYLLEITGYIDLKPEQIIPENQGLFGEMFVY